MYRFRRCSVLLIPVMLVFLLNACSSHRMVSRPLDSALDPPAEVATIYWQGQVLQLNQPVVKDEILTGLLFAAEQAPESPPAPTRNQPIGFEDEISTGTPPSVKTHSVHIFVSADFPLLTGPEAPDGLPTAIPLANIDKVQVREFDTGVAVLKTLGALALVAGIGFLIVMATKDSCPFIYVENGDDLELVGEIYSGAIHPPLERDDYLALPVAGDGPCRLRITNEVLEIQHTNLTELVVFDHPVGERVLMDRHGQAHRIAGPVAPANATSLAGNDVTARIAADDERVFLDGGQSPGTDPAAPDGMVLTFDRPDDASEMRLVVKARNSPWLDHVLGVLFERMGDMFKPWQEAQKVGSAEAMRQWSLDQGLPLTVSLLTPEGWRYIDYIDLAGPIAAREAVVALDLAGVSGDEVTVKLECGYRFWEIDRVSADFAPAQPRSGHTVGLTRAVTREGRDVTDDLLAGDDRYLHQPNVGDLTRLTFELPPLAAGLGRSVILHSRGHYDILRQPTGAPEADFVASFRRPGRVTEYSRELYDVLSGTGTD